MCEIMCNLSAIYKNFFFGFGVNGQILSSVLSLIRIGNAVPTIAGVTNANDGTGAAPPIRLQGTLVDRQGRGGNGGRPQGGTDNPPPSREQRDAWDMGPPSDFVPGL